MIFPRRQPIPYRPDALAYFEALRDLPWPVLLDSGGRGDRPMDIVAADPGSRLITRGATTWVADREAERRSEDDPFTLVRKALGPPAEALDGLPFSGGAIGYFGYDLARRVERLPSCAADADGVPDMCVGIYDWAVVVDHAARSAWLVGQGRDPQTAADWDGLCARLRGPPAQEEPKHFAAADSLSQSLSASEYREGFSRIKDYIRDGDCYQVNFALRFDVGVSGDPWAGYRAIRNRNPAPFGAFLQFDDLAVLSFSPERFLALDHGRVETRPIKGTRPRGATPEADERMRQALADSAKDRAENLMIVDLLRNDLGRVCVPGSVKVPRMFEVASFATVHHLVSTVVGELKAGEDALSLLRACFPGGSITGAPKIRAMQIIEALEPQRRGVYCGTIGHIGFDGNMDTNIVIRTLVTRGGRAWFWAGGGIVADSEADAEYAECLSKAGFLLDYFSAS